MPLAGGILVAMNSRLDGHAIEYILQDSEARYLFVDRELATLVEDVDLDGIETVVVEDTGEPDDPYEEFLSAGSPDALDSWLEDEDEPIAINYTSGTTGRSKGAIYTHRGAYLRAHGVALEIGLGLRLGPPLDAADVPLLRLVPHLGRHGGRRHAPVPAQGRSGEDLGAVRGGGRHPLQRRADGPHEHRQPRERPAARPARDRAHGRVGADADAALEDARAQPAPDPSLRPDRDLRPRHGLQLAAAVGRAVGGGAGEGALPPGPHLQRLRLRPGRGRGHGRRAARRARRSARS